MSYNVVTREGVRTFENIDDAGDYAQAMSLSVMRFIPSPPSFLGLHRRKNR